MSFRKITVKSGNEESTLEVTEEEYQKYDDYEMLVDEISAICQMKDGVSQRRITYWKIKRRYCLAMKYGDRKQMLKALWQMRKYGEKDFYHGMKDFIWRLVTK